MKAYIIRRLFQAVLVVFVASLIVFSVMHFLPGDPILMYIAQDEYAEASITPEKIEELRHQFGLDRPIPVQYLDWIFGVIRGDLGVSILKETTVVYEIKRALPKTIQVGLSAFILSIIFGIPAGIISAVRRGKWLDTVVTTLANLGITAPIFWVGILLVYFFGLYLEILPIYGYVSPFENLWMAIKLSILPIFCLTIFPTAGVTRQTRSAMLEVIQQDYIRTAWSKGLSERVIIFRHALKNSLIPVITLMTMSIRAIFGGQVLVETVFNIPGMGQMAVDAILTNDYAVVQGAVLVIAVVVTLANLLIDISYGWLDPRVRYE
ncbi:MAG: ABC transporter permease [Deltaproteobacteria bacterium]|nr:ABC transporter permease [Deltaproteobacteria bacterium]